MMIFPIPQGEELWHMITSASVGLTYSRIFPDWDTPPLTGGA